ncbi:MAG: SUMF1/EgtB/PvdO family nonheme iron enzyme, partial [Bacteroidales bacterium]
MKINTLLRFPVLLCFFILLSGANASNIQLQGKVFMTNKNTLQGVVFVNFSLKWQNSWRASFQNNWDAAWCFVKYRTPVDDWGHVYIDTNSSTHIVKGNVAMSLKVGKSNVEIAGNTYTKGLGVFLYRRDLGKGNVLLDSVQLKWNYRAQGIDNKTTITLRVFAVEMVYVPEGAFDIGDGNTESPYNSLSYRSDSNQIIRCNATQTLRTDGFWNAPKAGVTMNTIFAAGKMIQANESYPIGNINFSNVDDMYQDQYFSGTANQVNVYRSWPNYLANSRWNTYNLLKGSQWAGYHSAGTPAYTVDNNWHTLNIQLPKPFRASGFPCGWWSNLIVREMEIKGSNDSLTWTPCYSTANAGAGNNAINKYFPNQLAPTQAFSWYQFHFYVSSSSSTPQLPLVLLGLADRSNAPGFAENCWYYYEDCPSCGNNPDVTLRYSGHMPIVYRENNTKRYQSTDSYPNGYKAFYIMKYELSQHAYADFLNTLTYQQQQQRAANALPDKPTETRFYAATRNFLRIYIPGKIFNPGLDEEYQVPATYGHFIEGAHNWEAEYNAGNVAMNYLNWTDIAAYLCWAGLRPLTELEYEKACRGATKALLKEFAWGTKSMVKNEIG